MTLLTDRAEAKKLALARSQPNLRFLPFSASNLLAAIRTDSFSEIGHPIHFYFVTRGPLACVADQSDSATIYIHQLLNHSETPCEVISLIFKHELLHLRIPPVENNGTVLQHPPEFWEAEKEICPERGMAWAWVLGNLSDCIKRRPKLERIDVLRNWKKVWGQPKLDIASCVEVMTIKPEHAEEIGW